MCALDLARFNAGVRCAVSVHGSLQPVLDFASTEPIRAKLLVCHGDQDSRSEADVSRVANPLQ